MKKSLFLFLVLVCLPLFLSANDIPKDIQNWFDLELKFASTDLIDLESESFFDSTPARLIGYIENYSSSLGFTTGMIDMYNVLTGEAYSPIVEIQPDGRFEVELSILHPVYIYVNFAKSRLSFYIEPRQTLAMIIREESEQLNEVDFQGTLAQVNKELYWARKSITPLDLIRFNPDYTLIEPDVFLSSKDSIVEEYREQVKSFLNQSLLPLTKEIVIMTAYASYANQMLSYNGKKKLPDSFLSFLKKLPFDKQSFLIPRDSESAINHIAFVNPVSRVSSSNNIHLIEPMDQRVLIQKERKDSVIANQLGIKSSLLREIFKVRSLDFLFGEWFSKEEEAARFYKGIMSQLNIPIAQREATRIYRKHYPEEGTKAYFLLDNKETEDFKKIIEPYKGKVLFVDFWATTCGPCVATIRKLKEVRDKYKENPSFEFIFITEERSSPINFYNKFVEEQELTHSFRIPTDQYNYLRNLFNFNGFPHYLMVGTDGQILDDNFSINSKVQDEINKILGEN